MEKNKKKVKVITINADECNGCKACEAVCAAFHAEPKYGAVNPARSRIKVHWDPIKNLYMPVYAGPTVNAECMGRDKYIIDGKEYSECLFCRAAGCPSRDLFLDPDSGLPFKCDMCEEISEEEEPLCVQVCLVDALVYEEKEEEPEEEPKVEDLEIGLEFLAEKYGWDKVMEVATRMTLAKEED